MKNTDQPKIDNEIRSKVITFMESFTVNIGKTLNFSEAISTNKKNFDRHFTTYSSTEFKLTHFSARISGARIMFIGEKLNYEISIDRIINIEQNNFEILFIEAYSDEVFRETNLKIINESN
ncbi:MAG: hypothetical protein V4608_10650 [Bacteroidota bacterium]